jgi:CheY-like chemotaxis protein
MRILIVDDEPDVRKVLSLYLEQSGYAVVSAGSAEEAIPLAESGVDAVLMDIELPGVSGLVAVVAMAKKTRAPIFLMTGHSDLEVEKDALMLGAKALFPKPIDLPSLREKLAQELAA